VFPWPMVIVQFVMVTFELLMTMLELLIWTFESWTETKSS